VHASANSEKEDIIGGLPVALRVTARRTPRSAGSGQQPGMGCENAEMRKLFAA
jgi:hypothetical protein